MEWCPSTIGHWHFPNSNKQSLNSNYQYLKRPNPQSRFSSLNSLPTQMWSQKRRKKPSRSTILGCSEQPIQSRVLSQVSFIQKSNLRKWGFTLKRFLLSGQILLLPIRTQTAKSIPIIKNLSKMTMTLVLILIFYFLRDKRKKSRSLCTYQEERSKMWRKFKKNSNSKTIKCWVFLSENGTCTVIFTCLMVNWKASSVSTLKLKLKGEKSKCTIGSKSNWAAEGKSLSLHKPLDAFLFLMSYFSLNLRLWSLLSTFWKPLKKAEEEAGTIDIIFC